MTIHTIRCAAGFAFRWRRTVTGTAVNAAHAAAAIAITAAVWGRGAVEPGWKTTRQGVQQVLVER